METIKTILLIAAVFIGLPILSFMIVKFGASGFYRAKQRQEKEKQKPTED